MLIARKPKPHNLGLTIPVATRQARAIVDRAMPGVGATVESKHSHDPATDTPTVTTTITSPAGVAPHALTRELNMLAGVQQVQTFPTHIVITRKK